MHITVPSKTFLLGEYVAIEGGPALLLSTSPRFEMEVSSLAMEGKEKKGQSLSSLASSGMHPESPAGKLMSQDSFYADYSYRFIDPHQGIGGFGASSAQYVMLAYFKDKMKQAATQPHEWLEAYLKVAWDGKGRPPSGLDMIVQRLGGLGIFYPKQNRWETLTSWPFEELHYAVMHTGNKLATHEHLKTLKEFDSKPLLDIMEKAIAAVEEGDGEGFAAALNGYGEALAKQNLVAPATESLLSSLRSHHEVVAAKGCGALGADVVALLYQPRHLLKVLDIIKGLGLRCIATGNEVAQGALSREA